MKETSEENQYFFGQQQSYIIFSLLSSIEAVRQKITSTVFACPDALEPSVAIFGTDRFTTILVPSTSRSAATRLARTLENAALRATAAGDRGRIYFLSIDCCRCC